MFDSLFSDLSLLSYFSGCIGVPDIFTTTSIPCEDLLYEWSPDQQVLLIDLEFLEKLDNEAEGCMWNVTDRIRIALDIKSFSNPLPNYTRFDIAYYSNNSSKDYLKFHIDGGRIIPKKFDTRWAGNIEVPEDSKRFAGFWRRSKFQECLALDMNRKDTDEPPVLPAQFSTNTLSLLRDELIDMGMYPYLNGGTLLGWYRECTVIPHTKDMDLAVFKENYNPEYAEKILRGETNFKLIRKLGRLEDSLELTVTPDGRNNPRIDIFLMYDYVKDGKLVYRYTPGLEGDGTKMKYTHLLLEPSCAADLHDHIFWVPCDAKEQLKHEYGPLWYRDHPSEDYTWNKSPKNIVIAGKFTKKELRKYYVEYK
ncbi:hypothetical protein CRE_19312 [Caenorhabditis remanei]|uniref:W02B3.4-like N-terminal domain-containing protein n=1 Tax=Caenorhabditis remanei TaxID=31234 RepID=E3MX68_CAERE|nr:hypothetical protein CRE_19312 [Caenorhabditis remanei]